MVGRQPRSYTRIVFLASICLIGGLRRLVPEASIGAGELPTAVATDGRDRPASRPKLDLETATARLIEAHNRIRKVEKYPTLAASKRLQVAAELHAADMAGRSEMTHKGSDGSEVAERVKLQKYDYRRVGENGARGRFTIDQVMEGWMRSEVHRKNILGGFSQIGAAVALDEKGVPYWCVVFGLPRRK